MEKALFFSLGTSSAAYQLARDELARLQGQGTRTELESKILDDAFMAYDLESVLRGYADRIYKGETPKASWLEDIRGAWKFYDSDVYLSSRDIAHNLWPAISAYKNSVIEFERVSIAYLNQAMKR